MLLRKDRPLSVPLILVISLVGVGLLVYHFANIREEWVVKRFLEALKAEDYARAYQVWGPPPTYGYKEFLADWGGQRGYYGVVRGYKILRSETRGSGVIVVVEFEHLKKPVPLWVERKTHQLSFSPF